MHAVLSDKHRKKRAALLEQVSSWRVSTDQSEVFLFFLKRLTVSFARSTSDKHFSLSAFHLRTLKVVRCYAFPWNKTTETYFYFMFIASR